MFRRIITDLLMLVLTAAGLLVQPISFRYLLVATPVAQTTNARDHASAHKCCHSSSGLRFEDRGRHPLKGLPEDVHLYAAVDVALASGAA